MKFFRRNRTNKPKGFRSTKRKNETKKLSIEGLEGRTLFAVSPIAGANLFGGFAAGALDAQNLLAKSGLVAVDSAQTTSSIMTAGQAATNWSGGNVSSSFKPSAVTSTGSSGIGTAPRQTPTLAPPAEAMATGDFNGDFIDDLAIGMPNMDVAAGGGPMIMNPLNLNHAGAVRIIYGQKKTGLREPGQADDGSQLWNQNQLPGDGAQSGDRFGAALAVGDFNRDGFYDLAIGSPGEDLGAGAVHLLYGSEEGLDVPKAGYKSYKIGDEAGSGFGTALAAGNFDGKSQRGGWLAVGAPGAKERIVNNYGNVYEIENGEVRLYHGNESGLDLRASNQTLREFVNPFRVNKARFGAALAVGDFNGDYKDDLAVGAPHKSVPYFEEDPLKGWRWIPGVPDLPVPKRDNPTDPMGESNAIPEAGTAYIFHGSATGLGERAAEILHQTVRQESGLVGLKGKAETGDHFGQTLAAGDFNGDRKDDLAIGVPREDIRWSPDKTKVRDAGAVNVVFGSTSGLIGRGNQIWHQNNLSEHNEVIVGDRVEADDYFGQALTVGDFNDDGRDDLAIGVPGEDDRDMVDTGAVHILTQRRTYEKLDEWASLNNFMESAPRPNARFGFALAAGDFDGDWHSDLTVSAPGESVRDSGEVHILFGSSYVRNTRGPGWTKRQIWYEATDTLETWNVLLAVDASNSIRLHPRPLPVKYASEVVLPERGADVPREINTESASNIGDVSDAVRKVENPLAIPSGRVSIVGGWWT